MKTTTFPQPEIRRLPFPSQLHQTLRQRFPTLWRQRPHLVRLALNEAQALAVEEGFPALLFPTLAIEKVEAVAQWASRQDQLLHHSPTDDPLSLAA